MTYKLESFSDIIYDILLLVPSNFEVENTQYFKEIKMDFYSINSSYPLRTSSKFKIIIFLFKHFHILNFIKFTKHLKKLYFFLKKLTNSDMHLYEKYQTLLFCHIIILLLLLYYYLYYYFVIDSLNHKFSFLFMKQLFPFSHDN